MFQVSHGYKSVVTHLGDPLPKVYEPGLHWKLPWPIGRAHQIDVRRRIFNPPDTDYRTTDTKATLVLSTFVVWRVKDPLTFLQSVGTPERAERSLEPTVLSAIKNQNGQYSERAFSSTDPADIRMEELEEKLLQEVRSVAQGFGIQA